MEKPAITPLELHPLIKNRWSPRSFEQTPVEGAKIQRILEAARWAPSAFNEQPWRFIAGVKPNNTWSKLLESLVEWNRNWAILAPVIISVLGKKSLTKNGNPNATYQYDTGQAVAWITAQAAQEGLVVHQMAGFDKEFVSKTFDVPIDFEPISILALGYQSTPDKLPPDYQKAELAPRSRKEPSELFFGKKFGTSLEF